MRRIDDRVMPVNEYSDPLASRTLRKISARILPFVFLLYIVAYLDRANVAFAKLPMSADLGFSEAVYGFGAGLFFVGYLLLEIPGALIVERWSARRWIARILVTWGVCTVGVGLVRTPLEFYAARFLLGSAEAGFFPGILVYLTHWFPSRERARAMAGFIVAIPIGLALGGPISAAILRCHWFGLAGWRWMFILEGVPAILLGFVALAYLTDRPRQARWLDTEERQWLEAELEREKRAKLATGVVSVWRGLCNRDSMLLAAALFFANIGSYSFLFWLPGIVQKVSRLSPYLSNTLVAIPFVAGALGAVTCGRSSDRAGERKLHAIVPLVMAGVFFPLSASFGESFTLTLLFSSLAAAAVYAWPPPFWVLPTLTLTDSAAATAIGGINSIGNLGGFVGPTVVGYLLSRGWALSTTMTISTTGFVLSAVLIAAIRVPQHRR
ncbi:MAG: MFS transporter [Bryobacteraceae bacterium]